MGSDINFFLEGQTDDKELTSWMARCSGRGEIVEPIRSTHRTHFVVLHPPQGCSTKRIFQGIASELEKRSTPMNSLECYDDFKFDSTFFCKGRLFNRLQQAALSENHWIAEMLDELNQLSTVKASSMTGSGSAVFGIVETEAEAQTLANRLSRKLKVRAYAVSSWQTLPIDEQLVGSRA